MIGGISDCEDHAKSPSNKPAPKTIGTIPANDHALFRWTKVKKIVDIKIAITAP